MLIRAYLDTNLYLSSRITQQQVDSLLAALGLVGEWVQTAPTVIPAIGRDRKDDYLITYSQAGHADYLVSGDNDLEPLTCIDNLRIMTPAEFLALLDTESH